VNPNIIHLNALQKTLIWHGGTKQQERVILMNKVKEYMLE
jgi:hypothetical protein